YYFCFFFFQAEDGIRDSSVTGVQTCALPILTHSSQAVALLDHLVGDGKDARWNGKAECFRALEVDDELEHSRQHHRQVGWLIARSEERRVGKECGNRLGQCRLGD